MPVGGWNKHLTVRPLFYGIAQFRCYMAIIWMLCSPFSVFLIVSASLTVKTSIQRLHPLFIYILSKFFKVISRSYGDEGQVFPFAFLKVGQIPILEFIGKDKVVVLPITRFCKAVHVGIWLACLTGEYFLI